MTTKPPIRQRGLTLVELLIVLTMVVAIVGLISFAAQSSTDRTKVAGFESQVIQLRDAIAQNYANEQDLTAVTAARLWDNQIIPTAIRGPSNAAALRGPYDGLMGLSHITLTGETRPSVLSFSFVIGRETSDAALRDGCRQWVRALLPHFPYLAINGAVIATPTVGTHDVLTAADGEAAVTSQCTTPGSPPTVHFGMLL